MAAWFLFRHGPGTGAILVAAMAVGFLATGLLSPSWLRPLNRLWLRFGLLLHAVINPLILGVLFFMVFTPMGVVMRLFGADLLRLGHEHGSYWIIRADEKVEASSMSNQY